MPFWSNGRQVKILLKFPDFRKFSIIFFDIRCQINYCVQFWTGTDFWIILLTKMRKLGGFDFSHPCLIFPLENIINSNCAQMISLLCIQTQETWKVLQSGNVLENTSIFYFVLILLGFRILKFLTFIITWLQSMTEAIFLTLGQSRSSHFKKQAKGLSWSGRYKIL